MAAVLLALAASAIAVALFGRGWIARAIVRAPTGAAVMRPEDDPPADVYRGMGVSRQLRVEVPGARPASLAVWVAEPEGQAVGTVVMLHGIWTDKAAMLRVLGKPVLAEGLRAVLVDLRGHGRSSGGPITYGVLEAHDLVRVVDGLGPDASTVPLGVFGVSYGAAVAIQYAAQDPRVRAVVAVAPFSSLQDVVPAYAASFAPTLARFLPAAYLRDAVDEAGRVGGFDAREASPLLAIERMRARALLVHGSRDTHIPPSHSEAIQHAAPDRCERVVVDEDHASVVGSVAVQRDAPAWLREQLVRSR